MDIGGFTFRSQRGITLIEFLLVAVIVAASVVGVFIFAEKSTVSASVKEEQAQVEELARTVGSLFIMEPNFQALIVLDHCLDFMRPTGQYGSKLLSYLRDLSHHSSFAIKHNPAPRAAISANSIIAGFHPALQVKNPQVAFQPA